MAFRSGFVSIIGRPNAGKSTLLNALVGEKLAIVTRKPQTTRNRIQGVVNVERRGKRPAGQIVLIDTPGVHKPVSTLNRRMMKEVYDSLEGCDLLLLIVDAAAKFGTGDKFVLDIVNKSGRPAFLLLNKIDRVEKQDLLPLIATYREQHEFAEVLPISALKRDGLVKRRRLPCGNARGRWRMRVAGGPRPVDGRTISFSRTARAGGLGHIRNAKRPQIFTTGSVRAPRSSGQCLIRQLPPPLSRSRTGNCALPAKG